MRIFKLKYLLSLAFLLTLSVGVVAQSDSDVSAESYLGTTIKSDSSSLDGDVVDGDVVEAAIEAAAEEVAALRRPKSDSLAESQPRPFIDDVMRGHNKDSLIYNVAEKRIYAYESGEVKYQDKTLKADKMEIDLETDEVLAYGRELELSDGSFSATKPEFIDAGTTYTVDTILYNITSSRAKIKGVATKEGDGWMIGDHVKRMEDNVINLYGGKYTTCDNVDHPHFYIAMSKAKVIPNNKVVTGGAHLVIEDVHIPFLGIPEGFFPLSQGPKSGLLMPSYGEGVLGFFLKDLGYYLILSDHMDLTLLTGIYSLGSWEASASSRYVKNYKYSGNMSFYYTSIKSGYRDDVDYSKQNAFKLVWSHAQDAKANPGSTFSASVNFTTSGYSKYSTTNLNDILSTQTNSSISYSKSWSGTPFSLSSSLSVSQNSQTEAISMTFPTMVLSMSRIYPFKSDSRVGKERWYDKISMTYTGQLTNSVTTTESEIFTRETVDAMTNGISHSIPVSASFSAFNYLNITPSFTYAEKWYFSRQMQTWNPETNEIDTSDPDYGFYRLYNYSTSLSSSTTLYGMYQAKRANNYVQAIRHTMSPSFGFSYAPDFSRQKYGYYETVQSDSLGTTKTYSPYSNNAYGVPSSGRSLSMNFGISQTLAIKVLSDRDTTGVRKITLIDNISISGSYNFLSDSMRLSTIPVSFRTTLFGNFGLTLSATLDPYRVTPEGVRYDKLFFPGRVTSTGWSFGYTFTSKDKGGADNSGVKAATAYTNPFFEDPNNPMELTMRRAYMVGSYYKFDVPWSLSLSYAVSYGISYTNNGTTGYEPNVTQSLGISGSVSLTSNMGFSFQSGYDIANQSFTTSSVSISRDLHCWQMSMSWIPFGYYRSWSFNISVKAASLADLKYDKSASMYDNLY